MRSHTCGQPPSERIKAEDPAVSLSHCMWRNKSSCVWVDAHIMTCTMWTEVVVFTPVSQKKSSLKIELCHTHKTNRKIRFCGDVVNMRVQHWLVAQVEHRNSATWAKRVNAHVEFTGRQSHTRFLLVSIFLLLRYTELSCLSSQVNVAHLHLFVWQEVQNFTNTDPDCCEAL